MFVVLQRKGLQNPTKENKNRQESDLILKDRSLFLLMTQAAAA